ncbi:hypothetical protein FHR99_003181 [Litorivivens lipolytica]|uniref:Uncharacterized protein n=1 Tax=Litorivivens lipolytica TaxID=1524264 RepID=A0A7W4W7K3_9GAMM|nr:hypothetical protein [Litorivivens lipolytica]MBB3048907.1 hypothetical protein [Litorivivens lipolytica]
MIAIDWEDKFKRHDSNEIVGSELAIGGHRLSIHRHIYHEPDAWLSSCDGFFSQQKLSTKELDEAKVEALQLMQTELRSRIEQDKATLQEISNMNNPRLDKVI